MEGPLTPRRTQAERSETTGAALMGAARRLFTEQGYAGTNREEIAAEAGVIVDILSRDGWGPATVAVDGMEEFPVSGGGGQRITGDPLEFVLVATGRKDPSALGLDETVNIYREQ